MKKTLTALAMAACLALTPTAVFAEQETEAAASTTLLLQGIDDLKDIWTVALDASTGRGSVCLQQPDESGAYPEEDYILVYGPVEVGDDYMTITDDEDGLEYTFGMKDVEGAEKQVEMTYEPIGVTVILSQIDQNTVAEDPAMEYYAGFDENGNQWTVGFDFDHALSAIYFTDGTTEFTTAGTLTENEDETMTITLEDGSELLLEALDEDWTTLKLTDDEGVSINVSYVNPEVLNEAA